MNIDWCPSKFLIANIVYIVNCVVLNFVTVLWITSRSSLLTLKNIMEMVQQSPHLRDNMHHCPGELHSDYAWKHIIDAYLQLIQLFYEQAMRILFREHSSESNWSSWRSFQMLHQGSWEATTGELCGPCSKSSPSSSSEIPRWVLHIDMPRRTVFYISDNRNKSCV